MSSICSKPIALFRREVIGAATLAVAMVVSHSAFGQAQPGAGAKPVPRGFPEPEPMAYSNYAGWEKLFDGASLKCWVGHPKVWFLKEIQEGGEKSTVIAAEDSAQHAWPEGVGQTHLIYQGAPVKDFELKFEFRVRDNGNGGIQYRSYKFEGDPQDKDYQVRGYQFDLDAGNRYTGQLYEGNGRNIIAFRGQVVQALEGEKPRLIAALGDRAMMRGIVNPWPMWNQGHIVCSGTTTMHILNGAVTAIFVDNDPSKRRDSGIISLQLEGGSPKEVNYRNVYLKRLN